MRSFSKSRSTRSMSMNSSHRKLASLVAASLLLVMLGSNQVEGKLACEKFYDDFRCLSTEADSSDKFSGTASNKYSKDVTIDMHNVVDLCSALTPPEGGSPRGWPPQKPPKSATATTRTHTRDLVIAKGGKRVLSMEKPSKKDYCSLAIIKNCRADGERMECAKLIELSWKEVPQEGSNTLINHNWLWSAVVEKTKFQNIVDEDIEWARQ